MRKLLSIFTAGVMAAALLTGCGNASGSAGASSAAESSDTISEESETAASAMAEGTKPGSGSSVLVLYYSGSGHTKNIADMIAADTDADEYEIIPYAPYTEDDLNWTDKDSRVNREHEDESLQNVAFDSYDVPDWTSYGIVFVGYPIWGQDASWVLKS